MSELRIYSTNRQQQVLFIVVDKNQEDRTSSV